MKNERICFVHLLCADEAWVEQKNGVVVRRTVGYRRYEGLAAAAALARLYCRCGCS